MEKQLSLEFMNIVKKITKACVKHGKEHFFKIENYTKINPYCAENKPESAIKRKNVQNVIPWSHFAPAEWYMKTPRNFDMR